jgi:hypothetical protein
MKYIFAQAKYPNNNDYTHFAQSITLDTIYPVFTGTTLSSINVISGGYYSTTGITIVFDDIHLSGATLNNTIYTSGTLITGELAYTFIVQDYAGNSTGMKFWIDLTKPTISGVTSGAYYNT